MRTRLLPAAAVPVLAALVLAACGAPPHPRVAQSVGPAPAACDTALESLAANTAANLSADRRRENRARLPWTDTLPPAPVRDPAACARAAAAYAVDTTGGAVAAPGSAGVVRAGGLYFVVGWPPRRGGEFIIVGVLDAQFHWLVGVTT